MFVQKSEVIGQEHPRIDVVLSTVDEEMNMQITLKLWDNQMELIKLIAPGQLISAYAVKTGIFRNIKHVNSTPETQICVS